MLSLRSVSILAASVVLGAASARAATMDLFTFTSPQVDGPITVTLPASPTPSLFTPNTSFTIDGSVIFEGSTLSGPITFLNAGGATAAGTTFNGPILFSGPDANPTFLLGTFNLSGNADLGNGAIQSVTGTLVISQAPIIAPIPEPAELALTSTGIAGLIGCLRRRRTRAESI